MKTYEEFTARWVKAQLAGEVIEVRRRAEWGERMPFWDEHHVTHCYIFGARSRQREFWHVDEDAKRVVQAKRFDMSKPDMPGEEVT